MHLHKTAPLLRLLLICLITFLFEPVTAQTKRALLVGISEYQQTGDHSWPIIHGANDVEMLSSTLQKQGYKITKICNKTATANRIRKELCTLIASCKKGDVVYLHFSCHGQAFEDLDGDEEDGWDESIIPYDAQMVYQKGKYEGANHIKDDELHSYFQKLRKSVGTTGFVCIVVDACHSGGASRGEDEMNEEEDEIFIRGTKKGFSPHQKEYRPRINAKGHFHIPQISSVGDIIILEACRSYQTNYEIKQSGKFFGPLSYYVNQMLTRRKISRDIEWVQEVKKMMDSDKRLVRQNMVFETSLK